MISSAGNVCFRDNLNFLQLVLSGDYTAFMPATLYLNLAEYRECKISTVNPFKMSTIVGLAFPKVIFQSRSSNAMSRF